MNLIVTESEKTVSVIIPDQIEPSRIDKALSNLLSGKITRSSLSRLIKCGLVTLDGQPIKASTIVSSGQKVSIRLKDRKQEFSLPLAPVIDFPILYEDDHVIVLNKPAGCVVHPGAGSCGLTLVEALVASRPTMVGIGESGRWGIVHRLDKDTSGVMVVTKTEIAYQELSEQFRQHSIIRFYMAIVRGNPGCDSGVINKEIGRSRSDRKRMSTVTRKGRSAITNWIVKERYGSVSLMEIRPQTGRTHQIRVHLASVGMPIIGDRVYGTKASKRLSSDQFVTKLCEILKRQALHAAVLAFKHPVSGHLMEFSSDFPDDMLEAIKICRAIINEKDN